MLGDGNGHREFWTRHFSHRVLAPGFRGLKGERLTPEWLTTVAVTRHLEPQPATRKWMAHLVA